MTRARRAVAAPAVIAALALSGCGPSSTPEEQAHNEQTVEAIAGEAAGALPGVTVDTATFRDDAESDAKAYLFFRCDGCLEDRVVDRAVRALWRSTITPLHTFSVRVVDSADMGEARRDVVVSSEEAALVDELGERPVPSSTD